MSNIKNNSFADISLFNNLMTNDLYVTNSFNMDDYAMKELIETGRYAENAARVRDELRSFKDDCIKFGKRVAKAGRAGLQHDPKIRRRFAEKSKDLERERERLFYYGNNPSDNPAVRNYDNVEDLKPSTPGVFPVADRFAAYADRVEKVFDRAMSNYEKFVGDDMDIGDGVVSEVLGDELTADLLEEPPVSDSYISETDETPKRGRLDRGDSVKGKPTDISPLKRFIRRERPRPSSDVTADGGTPTPAPAPAPPPAPAPEKKESPTYSLDDLDFVTETYPLDGVFAHMPLGFIGSGMIPERFKTKGGKVRPAEELLRDSGFRGSFFSDRPYVSPERFKDSARKVIERDVPVVQSAIERLHQSVDYFNKVYGFCKAQRRHSPDNSYKQTDALLHGFANACKQFLYKPDIGVPNNEPETTPEPQTEPRTEPQPNLEDRYKNLYVDSRVADNQYI